MTGRMPDDVAEYITLEEFREYEAWRTIRWTRHEKWEYYLAQICGMLAGRKDAKLRDYLLNFGTEKAKPTRLTGTQLANVFRSMFGV